MRPAATDLQFKKICTESLGLPDQRRERLLLPIAALRAMGIAWQKSSFRDFVEGGS
jgi:hypothetical protein